MDMVDRTVQAVEDSHVWFPNAGHTPGDLWFWLICLGGETGELQNKAKKWYRGTLTWEEVQPLLADELVDALVYAFNTAAALGIDLEHEYNKKRETNDRRFRALRARAGTDGRAIDHHTSRRASLREDVPGAARVR